MYPHNKNPNRDPAIARRRRHQMVVKIVGLLALAGLLAIATLPARDDHMASAGAPQHQAAGGAPWHG